jgi:peroxiredoxin
MPATYLVNPEGQVVWRHVGHIDAEKLRKAFDEYLVPAGRALWQPLQLAVKIGERAPNFAFEYAKERWMTLRTLRGRRVLLNFWVSWSEPCISELQHLKRLQQESTNQDVVMLAINGEDRQDHAEDVFEKHRFPFILVADKNRVIARLYGVNCWPTTVSIDTKGFVSGTHFGLTPSGSARALMASA